MATRYDWMADTSRESFEKLVEITRAIPPGRKFEQMMSMASFAYHGLLDTMRKMYPDACEREVFLRAASYRIDRETMIKLYGWDPQDGRHTNRAADATARTPR